MGILCAYAYACMHYNFGINWAAGWRFIVIPKISKATCGTNGSQKMVCIGHIFSTTKIPEHINGGRYMIFSTALF